MSDDIRDLLHDTAPPPTRPVDAAGLVRRAGRQRRGLQVGTAATAAVVLVLALVGLGQLWPGSTPEVADNPPGEPPGIGILDTPRQPEDAIPEELGEHLGLEPAWAATSRLAREGAAYDYYVFRNHASQSDRRQGLCLLIAPHEGNDWVAGCTSDEGIAPGRAVVNVSNGEVTAGLVPDGVDNTADLETGLSEQYDDLAVVNNVFTTED